MTGSFCRLCGCAELEELAEFGALMRVTSDCRPWPSGGRLAACRSCGTLQKPHDSDWEADCRRIYSDYRLYPQSGGVEQAVFDLASGAATARSNRLLDRILAERSLPAEGRLLDVGCGNGAFLRAFHGRAPRWRLNGTELHDRYREEIEAIEAIEAFHMSFPDEVHGEFDWIVFLHVLEHIPAPASLLERLLAKLRPGGLLVVELPDHLQNPFDLAVADHSCHFSADTLRAVLERTGYEVETLTGSWIPREHTALSRVHGGKRTGTCDVRRTLTGAGGALRWLARTAEHARSLAAKSSIGVFGSSIGATWLTAELGDRVAFFVDEDPNREGRSHCGRPIYSPERCPAGVPVYVALPPSQGAAVVDRLGDRGPRLISPPAMRA